ncbi:MAG TPA: DUF4271 domain-containing protein [Salinimicrobium sp.]|nr:DUF4271 domain-containing protein [Salinimicrobium sp.]
MEAIEKVAVSHDWITLLLLGVFILLAITKSVWTHLFADFSMLFATNKYVLSKGKEPKIFHPFNISMFIINVVSAALFLYIFYQVFYQTESDRPKILFLRIATAYATFVLLKFSMEKILANIISLDKQMDFYLFYKLTYRNFIALILLPLCIVFIYILPPTLTVLYICVSFILLVNFGLMVSVFRKNWQFISRNIFYFILYLCALEIGPYFILYKLFTNI